MRPERPGARAGPDQPDAVEFGFAAQRFQVHRCVARMTHSLQDEYRVVLVKLLLDARLCKVRQRFKRLDDELVLDHGGFVEDGL